jgi:hypothetical protein
MNRNEDKFLVRCLFLIEVILSPRFICTGVIMKKHTNSLALIITEMSLNNRMMNMMNH